MQKKPWTEELEKLILKGLNRKEILGLHFDFKKKFGVKRKTFANKLYKLTDPNSKCFLQNNEEKTIGERGFSEDDREIKLFKKSSIIKEKDQLISTLEEENRFLNNIFENLVKSIRKRENKFYVPMREYKETMGERVAIFQLTDLHYGKTVKLEGDFKDLNVYDKDIAKKRIQKYFDKAIEYCIWNKINNVIVELGGDIFSGIIHDELKYYVTTSTIDDILDLVDCISYNLQRLVEKIDNVKVIGVPGNHGRLHKKMEFEFKATNNFDYLFYHILNLNNKNIEIIPSKSTFKKETINGQVFVFHHGDFTRGGKNMAGAPVFTSSRDATFVSKIYKAVGIHNVSTILIGHFHTSFWIPGLSVEVIGNGSLIGTDSYALENVLAGSANQNLVIVDGEGRVTDVKKIFVDDIKS
jgi:hypothetical protein